MDGQGLTVVSISMIVRTRHASMGPRVLMEWGASIVAVHPARRVCCATWTMPVHPIPAMLMPSVTPAPSTDLLHVPVHLDTRVLIALRTSMSAIKDPHVNTMGFASTLPDPLPATAPRDSQDHDARRM